MGRKLFFFFIDGVGLGSATPANPFTMAHLPAWQRIANEGHVVATDARLGVPGLPQSATGQTALYTGVNAPHVLGRHLSGQPTPTLIRLLQENNLLKAVRRHGKRAALLNAMRPEFFSWYRPGDIGTYRSRQRPFPGQRRFRPWAGIVAADAAQIPFRSLDDLARGEAVAHDIDCTSPISQSMGLSPMDAVEAGRNAAKLARDYDLTLYEHFLTDPIGHLCNVRAAVEALERIDRFLSGLIEVLDPRTHLLFITSDHGNLEDCSVKQHTFNPVGTYLWGAGGSELASQVRSLTDVTPTVLRYLCGR